MVYIDELPLHLKEGTCQGQTCAQGRDAGRWKMCFISFGTALLLKSV